MRAFPQGCALGCLRRPFGADGGMRFSRPGLRRFGLFSFPRNWG